MKEILSSNWSCRIQISKCYHNHAWALGLEIGCCVFHNYFFFFVEFCCSVWSLAKATQESTWTKLDTQSASQKSFKQSRMKFCPLLKYTGLNRAHFAWASILSLSYKQIVARPCVKVCHTTYLRGLTKHQICCTIKLLKHSMHITITIAFAIHIIHGEILWKCISIARV